MGCLSSKASVAPDEPDAAPKLPPKEAPAAPANADSAGAGEQPAWAEDPPPPLSDALQALVKQLYDLCDSYDGTTGDGIKISKLADVETSVGAHDVKLCAELEQADSSKDGVVTLDELTAYFTKVARFMSPEETELILNSLKGSLGPKWAEEPPPALSETRQALVTELYEMCDALDGSTGDGIKIAKLAALETTVGDHQVALCKELEQADTSKDGVVTLEELTTYFATLGRILSDDEFAEVLAGLCEAAGPKWAEEAPAPLSGERLTLVKELYDLLDPLDGTVGDGIQIAKVASLTTSLGDHPVQLCSNLADADTSEDGIVTLDELNEYFAMVGRLQSDDEFKLIMDMMKEAGGGLTAAPAEPPAPPPAEQAAEAYAETAAEPEAAAEPAADAEAAPASAES